MAYNPNGVVTQLFSFEDFIFTYKISGAVTAADVGKAVTIDRTAANTMKLAGDNDPVFGRLETFEDRTQEGIKVGAVSRKFRANLPSTGTLTVGDNVTGSATAGVVKASTANSGADVENLPTVIEVGTGFVVVEKL